MELSTNTNTNTNKNNNDDDLRAAAADVQRCLREVRNSVHRVNVGIGELACCLFLTDRHSCLMYGTVD